jgi:hypothetical protein
LDPTTIQALLDVRGVRAIDVAWAGLSDQGALSLAYQLGHAEGEDFALSWSSNEPGPAELHYARRQSELKKATAPSAARADSDSAPAQRIQAAYAEGFGHGLAARVAYIHYRSEYQRMRDGATAPEDEMFRKQAQAAQNSWENSASPKVAFLAVAEHSFAKRAVLAERRRGHERRLGALLESDVAPTQALLELQKHILETEGQDAVTEQDLSRARTFAARHVAVLEMVQEDLVLNEHLSAARTRPAQAEQEPASIWQRLRSRMFSPATTQAQAAVQAPVDAAASVRAAAPAATQMTGRR